MLCKQHCPIIGEVSLGATPLQCYAASVQLNLQR